MKSVRKVLFFITIVLVFGCKKDFIVEDISKKSVKINAPVDKARTTSNVVVFWWDELEGAESYNLQIVQPDFANAIKLMSDTNISGNKFQLTLKPGIYQWRVKATNAGYSTAFQTFDLTIDSTSNLSDQIVNLLSPLNGAVLGTTLITFKWEELPAAKKYRIQISGGTLIDSITSLTIFTANLKAAGVSTTSYSWNVKAINDGGESQFNSSPYTFTIDLKPPSTPGLVRPGNFANVSAADTMSWVHSGEAVYDSIYISEDSLFINTNQIYSSKTALPISDLDLLPSIPGSYYYWKVRSFDAVGNRSNASISRRFRLLP